MTSAEESVDMLKQIREEKKVVSLLVKQAELLQRRSEFSEERLDACLFRYESTIRMLNTHCDLIPEHFKEYMNEWIKDERRFLVQSLAESNRILVRRDRLWSLLPVIICACVILFLSVFSVVIWNNTKLARYDEAVHSYVPSSRYQPRPVLEIPKPTLPLAPKPVEGTQNEPPSVVKPEQSILPVVPDDLQNSQDQKISNE